MLRDKLLDCDLESASVLDHTLSTIGEHLSTSGLYFVHDKPGDGLPAFIRAGVESDNPKAKAALVELLTSENRLGPIDRIHRCGSGSDGPLAVFCEQASAQEAMVIPIPGAKDGQWFFVATRPKKGKHWRSGLDVHRNADVVRLLIGIAQRQEMERLRLQMQTRFSDSESREANLHAAILDCLHDALGVERMMLWSFEERERCLLLEASRGISAREIPNTRMFAETPFPEALLGDEQEWQTVTIDELVDSAAKGASEMPNRGVAIRIAGSPERGTDQRGLAVICLFFDSCSTTLWGAHGIRAIVAAVRPPLIRRIHLRKVQASEIISGIAVRGQSSDLRTLLDLALDETIRFTSADKGRILLFDETGALQSASVTSREGALAPVEREWGTTAEEAVAQVCAAWKTFIDYGPAMDWLGEGLVDISGWPIRTPQSVIAVPLLDTSGQSGRLLGVLQLVDKHGSGSAHEHSGRFGREEAEYLEQVSKVVSSQVLQSRLVEKIYRTIHQRDEAVETAMSARTRLEDSLQALHHELLSPMEPAIHRIEYFRLLLQEKGMLDDVTALQIDDILSELNQVTMLIDGANVMTAGDVHLDLEYGDVLTDVIEPVMRTVHAKARARDIRLNLRVRTGLPKMGYDRRYLKEALYNLLLNAIKYSHDGSDIEIITDREGDRLLLNVRNRGIGVPNGWERRIFEKGTRAPNAEAKHIGGAGLGLAIVLKIVNAHGGSIRLASKDEPTEFAIELPGG